MWSPIQSVNSFNPRPRTGSDRAPATPNHWLDVSIHAPARGATIGSPALQSPLEVSIHAPARGATYGRRGFVCALRFQSTPPHGERPASRLGYLSSGAFQSTPPHGERHGFGSSYPSAAVFQSTPPHGERQGIRQAIGKLMQVSIHAPARGATLPYHLRDPDGKFQSTPPHGERHTPPSEIASRACFNPRPRTGSDSSMVSKIVS